MKLTLVLALCVTALLLAEAKAKAMNGARAPKVWSGRKARCEYSRDAAWSECKQGVAVRQKVLRLLPGSPERCPETRTATKPCRVSKRKMRKLKKNRKRKGCKYGRKSAWSKCGPGVTTRQRERRLKPGSPQHCLDTLTITKRCRHKSPRKLKKKDRRNGCMYSKNPWQPCNKTTNMKKRELTLIEGDPAVCRFHRTSEKPCHQQSAYTGARTSECRYKAMPWGDCSSRTNTMTRILKLKSGNRTLCQPTKNLTRKCRKPCKFSKGEWSECDEATGLKKRIDHLAKGDRSRCEATRIISKMCEEDEEKCLYEMGDWSACDEASQMRTRMKTLARGSPSECEPEIRTEKPCLKPNGEEGCFHGNWGEYGPCQNGVMMKYRPVIAGGMECERKAVKTMPSRYPSSCDLYYQAGHTHSGVYLIDVDGPGPQEPSYVECAMGSQRDGHRYGATIIEHNFPLGTPVRDPHMVDRRYIMTYREMSRLQLMTLGKKSALCEQYFKYTCQQSPILLGKKTWFKAASGQVVDYLGAGKSGYCTCPEAGDGTCGGKGCFCDHDFEERKQDEGYSHNKEQLPVMEMTFLQDSSSSAGSANMTLGPFTCWGSDKQHLDNLVTLTTSESHVQLDTWRHGDLAFHFKTHLSRALLLLHTSSDTVFGNMMSLKIVSQNSVEFYFKLNGTEIREVLSTPRPVNQGDWHFVYIEHDPYNVRLSLDTTKKLVALNPALNGVVDFNGVLYLGGLPLKVGSDYREKTPGFSGCMRAFAFNGQEVELSLLVDDSISGVSMGCMSSCWPNPCQYGGTCKEEWGEYTCRCKDPWAHQGHNCEHNLNVDAVTFSGEAPSFLLFDLTKQANLDQTMVLSFRTFQSDALLLYACDHLNNFLQLQLQHTNTLLLTYNSYRTIVSGSITAPAPLNDGEWKQVIAQEYYNLTKLIYADQSNVIGHKRIKLTSYELDPFKNSTLKESVFIGRGLEAPEPFVRLYVGGVGQGATAIPFLKGCVRGMRVGNYHVNLGQGVQEKGNTSDLTAACDAGCNEDTCEHNGFCYEHWQYANFTCDCSRSDYSGLRCEKEASVLLDGRTVLEHTFTLPVTAQRSVTEQLMVHFRTSGSRQLDQEGKPLDMALMYIKSTEYEDYILARLDSRGNIMIETNQGVGIYRIKLSGNFANGELHELVYKREGTNMYLTLDGVKEASINYPDYDLEKIDTILIGGLLMDDQYLFHNTANFSGCISNTVFIPEANLDLKIRSLKEFHRNKPDVALHGPMVLSCSEANLTGQVVTQPSTSVQVTTQSFQILTMPTWEVGYARMVTLSPPRVLTPPPSSTLPPTTSLLNRTQAMLTHNMEASVDDLTIVIAVAVVAAVLIITVIAILLLLYKRRRHYQSKKDPDMELRQPLNYQSVAAAQSSPVPPDHLAKLDEFSTLSATLGPETTPKSKAEEPVMRRHQGNGPKADDGTSFEHPIFNRKKQRPASSISEVLEELERRQNRSSSGSADHTAGQPPGDSRSEPRAPLTYGDITFFNTPLLAPIPDENEDSHVSSLSDQNSIFKERPGNDSFRSTESSPVNHHSLLDGNGDSGYEAESRPETTEDDITPMGEEEEEEEADLEEEDPEKQKLYDTSGFDPEDSPILTSPSRQRLLKPSSQDT